MWERKMKNWRKIGDNGLVQVAKTKEEKVKKSCAFDNLIRNTATLSAEDIKKRSKANAEKPAVAIDNNKLWTKEQKAAAKAEKARQRKEKRLAS